MIDAGKLKITLSCDNKKVRNVEIESTRPLHTSRLFIGKTPEQTLKILPLLFNVCGVAQSFAAFQALGIAENSAETIARNLLLNVEIVREHCWWLLIHTDKARLTPFLKYVGDFKKALFVDGDAFSLNSQLEINHEQLNGLHIQLETDLDALFLNQRQRFLDEKNEFIESLKKIYYKKYPFAVAFPGNIWGVELTSIKMTDNTLGFGKKIEWKK